MLLISPQIPLDVMKGMGEPEVAFWILAISLHLFKWQRTLAKICLINALCAHTACVGASPHV